jgi:alkanesulfonate monooxygenase SsuD/methylene tetrahydromethanopterin reductase-like flavin-dependent oxidoreductase (luciferase family)
MAAANQKVEFGIYVPQLGFEYAQIRDRAAACEALGFHSIWFFDHLYGPELPDLPALEGWTLATAVLAQTTRLRVGHLVLSATFRHPALLAKMATTLDVISGGRLELGLGSGSYAPEHERAGMPWGTVAERTELLAETLEIVTRGFAEESVTTDGPRFPLRDFPVRPRAVQLPRPPIHVGGAGERRTLPLVARYADVWNCPTYALGELDVKRAALARECAAIGRDPASVRLSIEAVLVLAANGAALADAQARAARRFPGAGWGLDAGGFVGTPDTIVARIRERVAQGFTFFVFFTHDRAAAETLELFAREVMPAFA